MTDSLEINKKISNVESFSSDAAASLLLNYTTDGVPEDIEGERAALMIDIAGASGEGNTTGTSSSIIFQNEDQEEGGDAEKD